MDAQERQGHDCLLASAHKCLGYASIGLFEGQAMAKRVSYASSHARGSASNTLVGIHSNHHHWPTGISEAVRGTADYLGSGCFLACARECLVGDALSTGRARAAAARHAGPLASAKRGDPTL